MGGKIISFLLLSRKVRNQVLAKDGEPIWGKSCLVRGEMHIILYFSGLNSKWGFFISVLEMNANQVVAPQKKKSSRQALLIQKAPLHHLLSKPRASAVKTNPASLAAARPKAPTQLELFLICFKNLGYKSLSKATTSSCCCSLSIDKSGSEWSDRRGFRAIR